MKNGKQVRIDGRMTTVGHVKHWEWFPEADSPSAPDASDTSIQRWIAFNAVADAWRNLDPKAFETVLAEDDFTYGSAWVAETMRGKAAYLHYIRGKFETIKRTHSGPALELVCIREGLTPAQYGYGLLMTQGSVKTILTFDFKGTAISSMYMNDPDFFTLEAVAEAKREVPSGKTLEPELV